MFGELIGAWAAAVWRQMGAPARREADRARSRPRHADGGRAARRARRCRTFAPRFGASGRDEPGAARDASRRRSRPRRPVAWHDADRGRAGRPRDRDRQRIRRCAAGRPVRAATATAGTCAWSASPTDRLAFVVVARSVAGVRAERDAPAGAILEWRHDAARRAAGAPHRAARRRRADHRLRPRRRPASATRCRRCARTSSPIRWPIRARPTSPRRSISRRSPARRGAAGARGARSGHAGRIPAPPRHRGSAPRG